MRSLLKSKYACQSVNGRLSNADTVVHEVRNKLFDGPHRRLDIMPEKGSQQGGAGTEVTPMETTRLKLGTDCIHNIPVTVEILSTELCKVQQSLFNLSLGWFNSTWFYYCSQAGFVNLKKQTNSAMVNKSWKRRIRYRDGIVYICFKFNKISS